MSYQVLNVYPHDITCFTEGLEWHDSTLYESGGLNGESKLVRVSLKDGKDIKKVDLDKQYFGEGISILNGKLYQLTYKENKCFVYDPQTFKKTGEFTYQGQGWGMTNNGKQLIMDTGSNELFFIDPTTFTVVSKIAVLGVPRDIDNSEVFINELEWVDGYVYANVWMTNLILKIDPSNGKIVAQADLTDLYDRYIPEHDGSRVLNGIAYNSATKTFYITGKKWPKLFEVRFTYY